MTNTAAYQVLPPCVDKKGHRFTHANPEPGVFGRMIIYCTRCGKTRGELALEGIKK